MGTADHLTLLRLLTLVSFLPIEISVRWKFEIEDLTLLSLQRKPVGMKRLEFHSRPEQFVHVYEQGRANQPLLSFLILFSICQWLMIAHPNPTRINPSSLGWSVCPLLGSGPIGVNDLCYHTGWFLKLFKESFILVLFQVCISNSLEASVLQRKALCC